MNKEDGNRGKLDHYPPLNDFKTEKWHGNFKVILMAYYVGLSRFL
jgi:hypothetical protein